MKIKYEFADGTVSEVEVSTEIGSVIIESRKAEHAADERRRCHCPYSIDALTYEGMEYADPTDFSQLMEAAEDNKKLYAAFNRLSEVQRRRLLMLAQGLSLREISRREGVDIKTVRESVEGARKKFLRFF
jgi:DNA-directed RNA polymerase specialized sigma24 family protein